MIQTVACKLNHRLRAEQDLGKITWSNNTFGCHIKSIAHSVNEQFLSWVSAPDNWLYCWLKPLVASLVHCWPRIYPLPSFLITDSWFWSMHQRLQSQAVNYKESKSVTTSPFPTFPASLAAVRPRNQFWPMKYDVKSAEGTSMKVFGFVLNKKVVHSGTPLPLPPPLLNLTVVMMPGARPSSCKYEATSTRWMLREF